MSGCGRTSSRQCSGDCRIRHLLRGRNRPRAPAGPVTPPAAPPPAEAGRCPAATPWARPTPAGTSARRPRTVGRRETPPGASAADCLPPVGVHHCDRGRGVSAWGSRSGAQVGVLETHHQLGRVEHQPRQPHGPHRLRGVLAAVHRPARQIADIRRVQPVHQEMHDRRRQRPVRPQPPADILYADIGITSTCCATASATPAASTTTRSPRRCARSTPRRPRPPRWSGSWSSARPGASATRRSCGCGRTPGRSSCRSWPSTPRSARSSAPRMKSSTPSLVAGCGGTHFPARPPLQPEVAGPQPGSRWSARSAARTYDLDPGEDRRSVRRRWAWSDPVAKSRVWGCQPCRAASPREGLGSRAPVVAATSTPDLTAPFLRAAVRAAGRVGCQAATIVR